MRQIYSFIIRMYGLSLWISSLFNQKARDWFYGRREIFTKLEEVFSSENKAGDRPPVIWVHCASLGEYEQARPVIQAIKTRFPDHLVLLTFFSPSGYNNKPTNSGADFVFYLPLDTPRNANRFIKIVSPSLAIFVKYEFWYNYLHQLYLRNIPTLTISAIFRPTQHFFKWYGGWFRRHLRNVDQIFVQDEESIELLSMIDVNNVTLSGDTRFDRVLGISEQESHMPFLEEFSKDHFTLVAGSTWQPDEDILWQLQESFGDWLKVIIAPHEINQRHITDLSSRLNGRSVLYSSLITSNVSPEDYFKQHEVKVIIIDSIGLLSKIYRYGNIAYIGGGFGVGIHNTLEAAVYGIPVLFGPNYQKFKEARELIQLKAAESVKDGEELINSVRLFHSLPDRLQEYSEQAAKYVESRSGATNKIMEMLQSYVEIPRDHQS